MVATIRLNQARPNRNSTGVVDSTTACLKKERGCSFATSPIAGIPVCPNWLYDRLFVSYHFCNYLTRLRRGGRTGRRESVERETLGGARVLVSPCSIVYAVSLRFDLHFNIMAKPPILVWPMEGP